jgi:lipid A 3-O-deacylase
MNVHRLRRHLIVWLGCTICLLILILPADAEINSADKQTQPDTTQANPGLNPQEIFRKGAMNIGLTAGAGTGAAILGASERHDLALAYLHFGYVLTNLLAEERWYRGHLELAGETFGGFQYHPENRYVVGMMFGLRYNFIAPLPWVPFIDVGAGPSLTDIGEPDLSTTFQFNVQVGLGTHYFIQDTLALTLQLRGIHLSNAYIESPNQGSNTFLLLGGVSWFF